MKIKKMLYQEVDIEISDSCKEDRHWNKSYEIVWLLVGKGRYNKEEKNEVLSQGSLLVINPIEWHSLEIKDAVFIRIYIPRDFIYNFESSYFLCLPSRENENNHENYENLRVILAHIVKSYIDKEYGSQLLIQQHLLALLYELVMHFSIADKMPNLDNKRKTEIIQYIYDHFDEKISLEEIAKKFFLSPSYFSKMFRKQMGLSFWKYLSLVRLQSSINELVNTDKSITEIASQNGFPSLKSFEISFKRNYNASPSEYRLLRRDRVDIFADNNEKSEISKYDIERYLDNLIQEYIIPTKQYVIKTTNPVTVSMKQKGRKMEKSWEKMVNVGRATDILDAEIQNQLKELKHTVNFDVLHFHGMLDDEMKIYYEDATGKPSFNFFYLDKVVDFILGVDAKPFFEISFMPRLLASDPSENSLFRGYHSMPRSMKNWRALITETAKHFISKYTKKEVANWNFQVWDSAYMEEWWKGSLDEFCVFYKNTYEALKMVAPEIKVGMPATGTFFVLNTKWVDRFIEFAINNDCIPDFTAITVYPHDKYPIVKRESVEQDLKDSFHLTNKFERLYPSSNPDYMKDSLQKIKKKFNKLGIGDRPLYIVQWNSHQLYPEYTHDTLFKATYIIKNICECYYMADSFGYWMLTDAMARRTGSRPFNGGKGLINNNGIKKPGYFAYHFLKKLSGEVIYQDNGYFVTRSANTLTVLFYHYVHYKEDYCKGELIIGEKDDPYTCFENSTNKEFNIVIENFEPGRYKINNYRLNRNQGSSYDNWKRIGALDYLDQDDVKYIKSISYPYKSAIYENIDTVYKLHTTLEPHEICAYEFIRQELDI